MKKNIRSKCIDRQRRKELLEKLAWLRRIPDPNNEEDIGSTVKEAIGTLIECMEFLLSKSE